MTERTETKKIAAELKALEEKRQQAGLDAEETKRHQELMQTIMEHLHSHPGEERRRFLRIPADLEARFRLGEATITCGASELSMGGLSLRGHLWVIEDQELLVENLKVSNRDYPMAIKAKVVWKVSEEDEVPRAGLQFIDLDEQGRHQVRAIFSQLFMSVLEQLARD
jgi:c-di-GMP-binding flagellar brake protein YcgR